ncbi:MAG: signal peptidase I [Oscillospiraceae bacterium]|jgi:signal peptidase I|nr:signal peptidase I [Oscillospiraceae bacterium]
MGEQPLSFEELMAGLQSKIAPHEPVPPAVDVNFFPVQPASPVADFDFFPVQPPSAPSLSFPSLDDFAIAPLPQSVAPPPQENIAYPEAPPAAVPDYFIPKEAPAAGPDNVAGLDLLPLDLSQLADEPKSTEKTALQKLLGVVMNIVFVVLCVSLVGGSVVIALSDDPHKAYLGYRFYSVLSESMSPKADGSSPPGGFLKGDVILVKLVDKPEEIVVGDIITFNPNSQDLEDGTTYLTHRVVGILSELGGEQGIFFVTRGDHNNSDDPPISAAMLIGKKVATVPKLGGFLQLMRQHFGVSIAMVLSFFGFIFALRWYFAKPEGDADDGLPLPEPLPVPLNRRAQRRPA